MALAAIVGFVQIVVLAVEVGVVVAGVVNSRKATDETIEKQEEAAGHEADIKIMNVDVATVSAIPVA